MVKSNSDKRFEIIKQIYIGINQNNLEKIIKLFAPDVIRKEFEGLPTGGIYHGLNEIRNLLISKRSTWEEGSCNPEDFFNSKTNKVLVTVQVRVRLKDQSEWLEGKVIDGFSVKNNLVTEFHSFSDKQKALDWAES